MGPSPLSLRPRRPKGPTSAAAPAAVITATKMETQPIMVTTLLDKNAHSIHTLSSISVVIMVQTKDRSSVWVMCYYDDLSGPGY